MLGLLATLTALVWPRMQRRIARSQLKQLAIDLKEEIAEARSRAIRNGTTHELRFQFGGDEYWIGARDQLPTLNSIGNGNPGGAGLTLPGQNQLGQNRVGQNRASQSVAFEEITVGREAGKRSSQAADVRPWMVHRELDNSVYLADAQTVARLVAAEQAEQSEPVRPDLQRLAQNAETMTIGEGDGAASAIPWESILLTPDGRAEDRELAFCDRRLGLGIRFTLRGLTGQVEVGDFFSFSRDFEPGGISADSGSNAESPDADFPDTEFPDATPSRSYQEDDWE